ncbi:hypothetical protein [Aeromonas salmonicida]|uniref:hypothetical protein n=1 Tax=Aeromonas salmonicida TaxID=645 RepID=UPI00054DD6D7|nr:hypothetical protein [Aeromonas salmonicida]
MGEGAEIFFRLDVFGQFSGQCFEFVLVHLLTHEGILLKKNAIRGRLHNWIYRLKLRYQINDVDAFSGTVAYPHSDVVKAAEEALKRPLEWDEEDIEFYACKSRDC